MEVVLEPPAGSPLDGVAPDLLFLRVDDERVIKNRLHLDLRPDDQAAELRRLEALGATPVDIGQGDDVTWVVLADPEGNEFCVLRALRADEVVAAGGSEPARGLGEPLPAPARGQPRRLVAVVRRARSTRPARRDVPVLVSIGYAACHWCHVMAHESFEDPGRRSAASTSSCVAIKVDREERPDVDALYMSATQAMTGHGGWPMTVFVDPDAPPVLRGYLLPADAAPRPAGFRRDPGLGRRRLAPRGATTCSSRPRSWPTAVREEATLHGRARRDRARRGRPGRLERLVDVLVRRSSMPRDGGFSPAPKFPHASWIDAASRSRRSRRAATTHARWPTSRSTRWRVAGCSITSPAGSPATAWTPTWTRPALREDAVRPGAARA